MSQHYGFIIGHAAIKIAEKGSKVIKHKGTAKLTKSENIRMAI